MRVSNSDKLIAFVLRPVKLDQFGISASFALHFSEPPFWLLSLTVTPHSHLCHLKLELAVWRTDHTDEWSITPASCEAPHERSADPFVAQQLRASLPDSWLASTRRKSQRSDYAAQIVTRILCCSCAMSLATTISSEKDHGNISQFRIAIAALN